MAGSLSIGTQHYHLPPRSPVRVRSVPAPAAREVTLPRGSLGGLDLVQHSRYAECRFASPLPHMRSEVDPGDVSHQSVLVLASRHATKERPFLIK